MFSTWEAVYIGTNHEPGFDEELVWEAMDDKMTQVSIHEDYTLM